MPRLTSPVTGVTVNVSDEKAEALGSGWAPVEESAPAKKAAAKRSAKK